MHWKCEEVAVFMKHIGGHPNHYAPGVKKEIMEKNLLYLYAGIHISLRSYMTMI